MDTLKDPTPGDLADAWRDLTGGEIDAEALDALVAAIRSWPTGRLATAGTPPVVVRWQWVGNSACVAML